MEIFTGKILFPTSNTYEHLLMMERVTGTSFPKHMVDGIKAKEVKPLFMSVPNSSGSYIRQTPELTETLDSHVMKRLTTINVEMSHAGADRRPGQPYLRAQHLQGPDQASSDPRPERPDFAGGRLEARFLRRRLRRRVRVLVREDK